MPGITLAHGEPCVCNPGAVLELPLSKVSYHLQVLKGARPLSCEQWGQNSACRLEHAALYGTGAALLLELLTPDPALTYRIRSVC